MLGFLPGHLQPCESNLQELLKTSDKGLLADSLLLHGYDTPRDQSTAEACRCVPYLTGRDRERPAKMPLVSKDNPLQQQQ